MPSYYTIADYNDIITNKFDYVLPEDVISRIQTLDKLVNVVDSPTNIIEKPVFKKSNYKTVEQRHDFRSSSSSSSNSFSKTTTTADKNTAEYDRKTWKQPPAIPFIVNKIEVKEGIEKKINEIRVALNKLSNKNMETQKTAIVGWIEQVLNEDAEDIDENMKKIVNLIFNIASTNKFFSEIYADLYKELTALYSQFETNIIHIIDNYKQTLETIQHIDPNVNYDGYCDVVKINDKRKSIATFIVNLTKKSVLADKDIISIISYLQDMIFKYIAEPNRTNEVEEITENLAIFIMDSKSICEKSQEWESSIIPRTVELSKAKKSGINYPSISNRAVFKYMDILDKIKGKK
jgi:hypothetical protein